VTENCTRINPALLDAVREELRRRRCSATAGTEAEINTGPAAEVLEDVLRRWRAEVLTLVHPDFCGDSEAHLTGRGVGVLNNAEKVLRHLLTEAGLIGPGPRKVAGIAPDPDDAELEGPAAVKELPEANGALDRAPALCSGEGVAPEPCRPHFITSAEFFDMTTLAEFLRRHGLGKLSVRSEAAKLRHWALHHGHARRGERLALDKPWHPDLLATYYRGRGLIGGDGEAAGTTA
jgi:hypothetical protein